MTKTHRVIKATRDLQIKAGTGDIPAEKIRKANLVIENNTVDFRDISFIFLGRLRAALQNAKTNMGSTPDTDLIDDLTRPIMELKANGQPFKFMLVTILANIMLGFLEHIRVLDGSVIEIIEAHCMSLEMIVQKKITGDGGQTGALLKKELEDACGRYYAKNPQNFVKS